MTVMGLPMRLRISSNAVHSAAGMSLGRLKAGAATRFFREGVAFLELVVIGSLGATAAGVTDCVAGVPFWQGATAAGVPERRGWTV